MDKLKIFHGVPHEVERQYNEWRDVLLKVQKNKGEQLRITTQVKAVGVLDWSMGAKMPIVVLAVWYEGQRGDNKE